MTTEKDTIEVNNAETQGPETPDRYFIDFNWYQEKGRSFATLAVSRLCPTSRKKEKSKSDAALLKTLKQCCSKRDDFITPNMPLLEMVFRIFLGNGNQPLELWQIQEELQKYMGENGATIKDLSLPRLQRILDSDHYYGIKHAPEEKAA